MKGKYSGHGVVDELHVIGYKKNVKTILPFGKCGHYGLSRYGGVEIRTTPCILALRDAITSHGSYTQNMDCGDYSIVPREAIEMWENGEIDSPNAYIEAPSVQNDNLKKRLAKEVEGISRVGRIKAKCPDFQSNYEKERDYY